MIRINCDLGEGVGNDDIIMPLIDSCSIACGGHYGDQQSMRRTIRLAKQKKVRIGAHPSFEDKNKFGRTYIVYKEEDLVQCILKQVTELANLAEIENYPITHLKAHGALYNASAIYEKEAHAILTVLQKLNLDLALYFPPIAKTEYIFKESSQEMVREAFGDRGYNNDYSLVSRSNPIGVHSSPHRIVDQIKQIWNKGEVATIDGNIIPIKADTICLHGDGSGTVDALKMLRTKRPDE